MPKSIRKRLPGQDRSHIVVVMRSQQERPRRTGLVVSVLLLVACASDDHSMSAFGDWGGLGLQVQADPSATVLVRCGGSSRVGPLSPDSSGRFDVRGPITDDGRQTRITGRLLGSRMEVEILICSTTTPCSTVLAPTEDGLLYLNTFLVERGAPARWSRRNGVGVCVDPICVGCPP